MVDQRYKSVHRCEIEKASKNTADGIEEAAKEYSQITNVPWKTATTTRGVLRRPCLGPFARLEFEKKRNGVEDTPPDPNERPVAKVGQPIVVVHGYDETRRSDGKSEGSVEVAEDIHASRDVTIFTEAGGGNIGSHRCTARLLWSFCGHDGAVFAAQNKTSVELVVWNQCCFLQRIDCPNCEHDVCTDSSEFSPKLESLRLVPSEVKRMAGDNENTHDGEGDWISTCQPPQNEFLVYWYQVLLVVKRGREMHAIDRAENRWETERQLWRNRRCGMRPHI
mmetsp:Transcript_24970/g.53196  ORF Transcript_24970/g.53196 Transcript_24970/m.53196 type:complete len:279 (-) Transcript_24970:115-951(-)